MKEKDIESLQHTTWRCQYHVVFAPKYRRMQYMDRSEKISGKYCESCVSKREWKL